MKLTAASSSLVFVWGFWATLAGGENESRRGEFVAGLCMGDMLAAARMNLAGGELGRDSLFASNSSTLLVSNCSKLPRLFHNSPKSRSKP